MKKLTSALFLLLTLSCTEKDPEPTPHPFSGKLKYAIDAEDKTLSEFIYSESGNLDTIRNYQIFGDDTLYEGKTYVSTLNSEETLLISEDETGNPDTVVTYEYEDGRVVRFNNVFGFYDDPERNFIQVEYNDLGQISEFIMTDGANSYTLEWSADAVVSIEHWFGGELSQESVYTYSNVQNPIVMPLPFYLYAMRYGPEAGMSHLVDKIDIIGYGDAQSFIQNYRYELNESDQPIKIWVSESDNPADEWLVSELYYY